MLTPVILIVLLSSPAVGVHFDSATSRKKAPAVVQSDVSLKCSAITALLTANGGKIPKSVDEWIKSLARFGKVNGVLAPLSRAPASTTCERPRILLALQSAPDKPGMPNLHERLFIGLTLDAKGNWTAEFISKNLSTHEFDFGVIEDFNKTDPPRLTPARRPEPSA